jgi:hypothetical protein
MTGRDSLVLRSARQQGITLFAKAGTLARSATLSKRAWQSKRALGQPGLVLAACRTRAICINTATTSRRLFC